MSTAEVVSISRELNVLLLAGHAPRELRGQWEGRELPGPGLYRDMPMDDYLALPYVGASRIEKMRRSPLQYRYAKASDVRSDERDLGSAVHMAVLEPGRFEGFYIVLGQCDGITNKGKGPRCNNTASVYRETGHFCGIHDPHKGQPMPSYVCVISREDYDATIGMRDAVLSHPRGRSLFQGKGDFEVTVIFDDPDTGIRCKIRPDRLIERAGMNVDIKTTYDAASWAFPRQAENLGYFRKLAFYRRGLRTLGWPYAATAVLAIESALPFDLVPYLCDESDLDDGEIEVVRLLRQVAQCLESDAWPGYAVEFAILQRPAWARERVNHD